MTLGIIDYRLAHVLFWVLLAFQIFDVVMTRMFLKKGTAYEANPVMAKLFAKIGFWPAMALKLALFTGVAGWLAFGYGFWFPMVIALFVMLVFVAPNLKYALKG